MDDLSGLYAAAYTLICLTLGAAVGRGLWPRALGRAGLKAGEAQGLREQLHTTEAMLAAVMQNASVILWAVDLEGVFTYAAGKGLRLSGFEDHELVGQNVFVALASKPAVIATIRNALKGSPGQDTEQIGNNWFEAYYAPLYGADGKINGAVGLSLDITERKTSESINQASQRLTGIIEAQQRVAAAKMERQAIMAATLKEVIILCDADGADIALMTDAGLVSSAGEGTGVSLLGEVYPVGHSFSGESFFGNRPILSNTADTDVRLYIREVASLAVKALIVVPVPGRSGPIGILKCLSHRPGAFDALHMRTLELFGGLLGTLMSQADEFQARQTAIASLQAAEKDLIRARVQAEQGARQKTEFLANMSHEIRTPLNGVIGMTDLLLETELTYEQQRYARIVQESGTGLLTIINDILDFSKIEAGRFELESVNFAVVNVVEDQVALLSRRASEHDLNLISFVDPQIAPVTVGDPGRIGQILLNLLGNAIKFTKAGTVSVRATLDAVDGNVQHVRFTVDDSGIGISSAVQAKLFEPFTQADGSTARRFGGTGLGLSISKRLVEMQNGTIGVVSDPGHGSSFWFVLPLRVAAVNVARPAHSLGAWAAARVLVVEPVVSAGHILCRYLRSWEADAVAVTTVEQAEAALITATKGGKPFSLLLISDAGPDYLTLKHIHGLQQQRGGHELPIVLMSPQSHEKITAAMQAQNVEAMLQKPIRQSELHDAIQATLLCMVPERPGAPPKAATVEVTGNTLGRSKRILVADDNQVNLLLAATMLKALGYAAQTVANGQEVITALKDQHFDLILMDCQMPEMDGYEATRAIRNLEVKQGGHIPIVALTANALQEDAEKCLAAGMDAYLTKPIKKDRLGQTLSNWLSHSDNSGSHAAPTPR